MCVEMSVFSPTNINTYIYFTNELEKKIVKQIKLNIRPYQVKSEYGT